MAVDHVGGEVHEPGRTGPVHRLDDVDRAKIVHRKEEIVALGTDLDGREHLGRQVVDHVVRLDADSLDRGRVGHVATHVAHVAIVGKIAPGDVCHQDLLAFGGELGGKVAADEAVAAEYDVSHWDISLLFREADARAVPSCERASCCPSRSWLLNPLPLCAIRIVPRQMQAMPAMRQPLMSSRKMK